MRRLSQDEKRWLDAALARYKSDLREQWERDGQEIWTDAGAEPNLFLVAAGLAEALAASKEAPKPDAVGLQIGSMRRGAFEPSLEGAYEIARHSRTGLVRLRPKGAQLFLYGRDVLGESIASADRAARPGTLALVANEQGEVLGLARVLEPLPGRGRVLEPVIDRGWYLREGG